MGEVMDWNPMRLEKRRLFLAVLTMSVVAWILHALGPSFAVSTVLGVAFALLVLHGAWHAGGRVFGLLILAVLLTVTSVLVERYGERTTPPVLTAAVIDLALQAGALISAAAAIVIWVRTFGRDS